MKHNYHAHTPWSNHASIEPEDSIKKAISLGFKTWGFSEHSFQDGEASINRLRSFKDMEKFVKQIFLLKEKYKEIIDIKIGIEFDYRHDTTWANQIPELKKTLAKIPEIEYVLYAPHYYAPHKHAYDTYPTKGEMKSYLKDIRDAFSEFNFSYIVHADSFCKGMGKWTEDAKYLAEGITHLAVELDIPLGLNANGIGYGLNFCYPRPEFWKIAAKNGAKAILELDSHSDRSISQERIDYIKKIVEDTGVTLVDKLDI